MAKNFKLKVGDMVAFNKLEDAAWFEIVGIDGFSLTVREAGTDYATQQIDRSVVAQHRAA